MSAAYRIVSTTTTTQTNGSSRRMARGYPRGVGSDYEVAMAEERVLGQSWDERPS